VNLPGAPHARYVGDLREADALVADGWAAEHLPPILGRSIDKVPKGVDADLFTPSGGNCRSALGLAGKHVVIAVGRLVPIKNMRLLVAAMPAVLSRVPTAHALIVGEGPDLAMLKQLALDLDVAASTTFTRYVPNADLAAYYRSADLFVLSSTFDNSPNAVLEAMACGLPVVCTDVGGVSEFVDGDGGELVPSGDTQRLAAAITSWLDAPDRRTRAATHNRRAVLDRYSWRASAERLLAVYNRVIAARARRRQVPA
jgi:phosphatidylinositol alpha-1,6-mannosyltransferase